MADFRLPPLNVGERFYRALLHLYPRRFRRTFTQDLVETFRDARRDAVRHGVPATAFWLETLRDLLTQSCAERASSLWHRRKVGALTEDELTMAVIPFALNFTELRLATRRLRRAPTFTIATVLVLALGIGATTAVFSVVNGVLLRPLPYPAPDRLVSLQHTADIGNLQRIDQSDATLMLYQKDAGAFDGVGGWRERDVNLGSSDADPSPPERLAAAWITANLFDVLRVRPALGRTFRAGEDRDRSAPVVIISDRLWHRRFGGDPAVVGKRLIANGLSREIVGVMPPDFIFPHATPELWIPVPFDPANANVGGFNYEAVGRLRDGMTIDAAQADLARVLPRVLDEFPGEIPKAMWERAHVRPLIVPMRESMVGDVSRLLWILLGSVSLVLVIACANVASLLLVRGESRSLELAVRSALGSGIGGIVAQCLSEAFVLSIGAGALGASFAAIAVRALAATRVDLGVPRLEQVSVDGRVLAFTLVLSVLCAVVVSIIPILRVRHISIATVLRESTRGSTAGKPRQRARSLLVVGQVALALVLVASSGLLARSFARLRDVKPGFEPSDVVMARIVLPEANYPNTASVAQLYNQLLDRVRAVPGVREAAIADWVPLTSDHNDNATEIEDHPLPPNALPPVHYSIDVEGNYFKTMSIPLLSGRSFSPIDAARPQFEAVVSKAFAAQYWPNGSPLGRRVRPSLGGQWYTIVGVAADVHYDALDKPAPSAIYYPLVQGGTSPNDPKDTTTAVRFITLLARETPEAKVSAALRSVVRSVAPAAPTYDERTLTDVVDAASARARATLLLLAAASAIALVLGTVGIYGVMAYGVTLRQREISVRIALGAPPAQVRRMISRQGFVLGLTGVSLGVVLAIGVTRLLRGFLYEVSPTDPLTLIGTCIVLLAIAALASWGPARAASAIDPAETLRAG
jgi:predicted permease